MLIGAHISVADGYPSALKYALEVGCECMQIFAKSPRQWQSRALHAEDAAEFAAARERAVLGPLFTHAAYLINLATIDPVQFERSVTALADELERGRLLGAAGVVVHIGSDPLGDREAAAERVVRAVHATFERCGPERPGTRLLLENTAGTGHSFGGGFGDFTLVFEALAEELRPYVGVCLDTCHAHAAGYDLTSRHGWDVLLQDIERACGLAAVGLVHANDCKFECGAHKDRHEWIGRGFLGREAFLEMFARPELGSVCVVTEMPGEIPDKDSVNNEVLRELRDAAT